MNRPRGTLAPDGSGGGRVRVVYRCSRCGRQIAELHLPVLSEAALGLGALTPEERADIISFDAAAETVSLRSLCDRCVEGLEMDAPLAWRRVH